MIFFGLTPAVPAILGNFLVPLMIGAQNLAFPKLNLIGWYLFSLGGLLLLSAFKVWRGEGNKVAWKMYRHSSMYLAFLFLALMVDALV